MATETVVKVVWEPKVEKSVISTSMSEGDLGDLAGCGFDASGGGRTVIDPQRCRG